MFTTNGVNILNPKGQHAATARNELWANTIVDGLNAWADNPIQKSKEEVFIVNQWRKNTVVLLEQSSWSVIATCKPYRLDPQAVATLLNVGYEQGAL